MAENSQRKLTIEFTEKLVVKELPSSLIVINPIKEINDALARNDYFSAFALAVTYFEYYGYKKLRGFFEEKISGDKLEGLTAVEMTIFLFGLDLIDCSSQRRRFSEIQTRQKQSGFIAWKG